MRRLTKREKIIFVICGAMLSVLLMYRVVVIPLAQGMDRLQRNIELRRGELSKNIRIIKKAEALSEGSESYVNQFKQTESNKEVMSSLISEIEEAANKLDLPIPEVKPKKVEKQEYVNRFSVNLVMESEWIDSLRFIHSLQEEPHFFSIKDASFEKGLAVKGSTAVRTEVVLEKVLVPQVDAVRQKIVLPAIALEEGLKDETPLIRQDFVLLKPKPFEFYEGKFKQHIFMTPWEKLSTDKASSTEPLTALSQVLKVVGIFLDYDPKVIVEDLRTKQVYFLSPGESLSGAIVEEIREDTVVFRYNNQKIEMAP